MMSGVCMSVCRVPRNNSRTERPRKAKFGGMEAHHTGNRWTYLLAFTGQKVKVPRLIIAVTDNAPYAGLGHYNFLKINLFSFSFGFFYVFAVFGRSAAERDCEIRETGIGTASRNVDSGNKVKPTRTLQLSATARHLVVQTSLGHQLLRWRPISPTELRSLRVCSGRIDTSSASSSSSSSSSTYYKMNVVAWHIVTIDYNVINVLTYLLTYLLTYVSQ